MTGRAWVKPGVVSIDGTRIAGNASPEVNHTFDQIAREVLAEARAEITNVSTDFSQLSPMVTATLGELERAGIDQPPETVAADAGY